MDRAFEGGKRKSASMSADGNRLSQLRVIHPDFKRPARRNSMRTQTRKISGVAGVSLALLLAMTFGSRLAHGQAQHVRWDIVTLSLPGATVNPGGQASAKDNLGNTLTLTGTGQFVAPAGGGGTSSAVTGGGGWRITTATGTSSGTYVVTGLVRWEDAPGSFPGTADNIGGPGTFRAGLAVLRIEYSDGSPGILVLSCHGAGTADTVFEGITASKGYVDFWNTVPPSGTPATANANRTSFHLE
jgi:hypothetical protein